MNQAGVRRNALTIDFFRRTAATRACQCHAIRTHYTPANFQCVKISTLVARDISVRDNWKNLLHALLKFSAIAIAFRIAMDLLMVS